jgi:galactonate dehydratase
VKIERVDSFLSGGKHFVTVVADDGVAGVGQSGCWAYPRAAHAVTQTFARFLVGQDPRRIEHLWQYLYRMGPFRGSILGGAISAVDIALWDLKGKHLGVPVWELLGGRTRDRVRLHLLIGGATLATLVESARSAAADGFTAIKFDPLPHEYADLAQDRLVRDTVDRVAAVREAVGPDVDLILELHRKPRPMQALVIVEALRAFHPLFAEDPVQIDSISSQADVSRRLTDPIGNGERLHSIWEFRELLVQGGSQYVRPDVGLAGGISHCRKIAALAESFHSVIVTHNFYGPLLTAASVQLDVAVPNVVVQEYSLADESSRDPIRTSLRREGGWMIAPEAPGIGVVLDVGAVSQDDGDDDPVIDIINRRVTDIPLRADGSVAYSV